MFRAIRTSRGAWPVLVMLGIVACEDDVRVVFREPMPPHRSFFTSLHATGQGKLTFYSEANGGFEQFTRIPYERLSCKSCHEPDCQNCHVLPGDEVADSKCLGCHGRQGAEIAKGFYDVHRSGRGDFNCMTCHTTREMHGDGTPYASMLEPGAMDANCESCHPTVPPNPSHTQHLDDVACASCHMRNQVTCYNCHFESEVASGQKRAYGQFTGWTFLVNREGKVHPANFQSVTYQGKSFVAFAPFYAHSIWPTGRACADCHESPALAQYVQEGKIDVVRWDSARSQLVPTQAVIPLVPNFGSALNFDFVDYVNGQWVFLKSGADAMQLLYAEPLRADQLDRLAR